MHKAVQLYRDQCNCKVVTARVCKSRVVSRTSRSHSHFSFSPSGAVHARGVRQVRRLQDAIWRPTPLDRGVARGRVSRMLVDLARRSAHALVWHNEVQARADGDLCTCRRFQEVARARASTALRGPARIQFLRVTQICEFGPQYVTKVQAASESVEFGSMRPRE